MSKKNNNVAFLKMSKSMEISLYKLYASEVLFGSTFTMNAQTQIFEKINTKNKQSAYNIEPKRSFISAFKKKCYC